MSGSSFELRNGQIFAITDPDLERFIDDLCDGRKVDELVAEHGQNNSVPISPQFWAAAVQRIWGMLESNGEYDKEEIAKIVRSALAGQKSQVNRWRNLARAYEAKLKELGQNPADLAAAAGVAEVKITGVREVSGEFRACNCSVHADPHYHVDDHSVVPWANFIEAFDKFMEVNKSSRMPFSIGAMALSIGATDAKHELHADDEADQGTNEDGDPSNRVGAAEAGGETAGRGEGPGPAEG